MPQSNDTLQGGKIQIRETKRGIEFHAFNFERQGMLHIGTLQGAVYEKVAAILRLPEPSIPLSLPEFGAAVEAGAAYLRCIPPDKSATYSISLENFKKHAVAYHNPQYGPQWRVPLGKFSQTNRTGKRNPVLDNPPLATGTEYDRPQPQQLPLFELHRPLYDEQGNFVGGVR